jgi:hypothetical protein
LALFFREDPCLTSLSKNVSTQELNSFNLEFSKINTFNITLGWKTFFQNPEKTCPTPSCTIKKSGCYDEYTLNDTKLKI